MRRLGALFAAVCVAILLWAAWVVPLPFFLERPGEVLSLDENISVAVAEPGDLGGDFLLAIVRMRRATPAGLVRAAFDPAIGVIEHSRLVPPGMDDPTFFAHQREVFVASADVAAAIGLAAAGYPVDLEALTGDGAVVVDVLADVPAAGVLTAGDVIVAVDGEPVATADELRDAVSEAGTRPLAVRFRSAEGDEPEEAVLTPVERDVDGELRPLLGVQIQTLRPRIELPVGVEIERGRIGGPSAGLLIALTVYDKAAPTVDLTGGRRIAGTGGINADGTVQTVGGVPQKVLAAHEVGADVFLVPAPLEDTARAVLPRGSRMEIFAVGSFDDAVLALTAGRQTTAAPLRLAA